MNVSVIIPTFNRADLVCQAIDSVLSQTEKVDEIFVMDDGSTDDTPARLHAFGETISIITQSNRGISSARNVGIQSAQCEWLTFLDSDDLWKPTKLEKQKEFLIKNPEYQICYTDEEWRKNDTWVNAKKVHHKVGGWIYDNCLPRCIISASSVLLHRRLFDDFGLFDENLPACEDYDLWLRLSSHIPIGFIPDKLIVKRDGPWEQLSHQHSLDKYRIVALTKKLSQNLDPSLEEKTRAMLHTKCSIYVAGCKKYERLEEITWIHKIAAQFELEIE